MTQRDLLIGASLVAGAALLSSRAKKKASRQRSAGRDLPPEQAPADSSFSVLRSMMNPNDSPTLPPTPSNTNQPQWNFASPVEEKNKFNERLRFDYQRRGLRGRNKAETQNKIVLPDEGSVPPPPPPIFNGESESDQPPAGDNSVAPKASRPKPSFYPTAEDILNGVPDITFNDPVEVRKDGADKDELGVTLPMSSAADWEAELARYQRERAAALAVHAKIASDQVGQGLYSPKIKEQRFPIFRSSTVLTGGHPDETKKNSSSTAPLSQTNGFVPKVITVDGVTGVAYDSHTGLLLPDPSHAASVSLFETNVRAVMAGADPGQLNDMTYQLIADKSVL